MKRTKCCPTRSYDNASTMAMTRTILCRAKVVPSLVEDTHSINFSNKQQAADSSSVPVVVDLEASRSISQVAAVESISESRSFDSVTAVFVIPALILTVCLERFIFQRSKNDCILVGNHASSIEQNENTSPWVAHPPTPSFVCLIS